MPHKPYGSMCREMIVGDDKTVISTYMRKRYAQRTDSGHQPIRSDAWMRDRRREKRLWNISSASSTTMNMQFTLESTRCAMSLNEIKIIMFFKLM